MFRYGIILCFLLCSCEDDGPRAKSFAVQPIIQAAADDEQLVWAFMGDGYTAEQQDAFAADVQRVAEGMLLAEPFNDPLYKGRINVYAIHAISEESGVDRLLQDIKVDTHFNARFGEFGISTLLTADQDLVLATAFKNVPSYDTAWLLVNDVASGGSGGEAIVMSNHPANVLIGLHEYGHSFAHLADEYTRPYPGFPAGDSEPNVTYQQAYEKIPWKDMITDGASLPTTVHTFDLHTVGLFEGARYQSSGIFRPQQHCRMRSLSWHIPFCKVCMKVLREELNYQLGVDPDAVIEAPIGVAFCD